MWWSSPILAYWHEPSQARSVSRQRHRPLWCDLSSGCYCYRFHSSPLHSVELSVCSCAYGQQCPLKRTGQWWRRVWPVYKWPALPLWCLVAWSDLRLFDREALQGHASAGPPVVSRERRRRVCHPKRTYTCKSKPLKYPVSCWTSIIILNNARPKLSFESPPESTDSDVVTFLLRWNWQCVTLFVWFMVWEPGLRVPSSFSPPDNTKSQCGWQVTSSGKFLIIWTGGTERPWRSGCVFLGFFLVIMMDTTDIIKWTRLS